MSAYHSEIKRDKRCLSGKELEIEKWSFENSIIRRDR